MSLTKKYIKEKTNNDLHDIPLSIRSESVDKLLNNRERLSEKTLSIIIHTIKTKYEQAKVEDGDAVGIIAAQSIGEPSTQLILRTFHYAGEAFSHISGGMQRIKEIVDAVKKIKNPVMKVFLRKNANPEKILKKILKLQKIKVAKIVEKDGEKIIYTEGTDLGSVLGMSGVNQKLTTTNDIREIEKVLGIEAARYVIIDQLDNVFSSQNLDVDIRHIILLADIMTMYGNVDGIGRMGVIKQKSSPIARMSYERSPAVLYHAAVYGETEEFNGVVENIIGGLFVNVGTGSKTISLWWSEEKSKGKNIK